MSTLGPRISERQAAIDYYKIDPTIEPSPEELESLLRKIYAAPADNNSTLVTSNINFELANTAPTAAARSKYAYWLGRTLEVMEDDPKYNSLQIHYPFIKYGWGPDTLREFNSNVGRILLREAVLKVCEPEAHITGRNGEHLASFVANNIRGLYAQPSYGRQERNTKKVDGMNYNWDLTILSSGQIIEAGEYRCQVKANGKFNGFHPDIVRLNMRHVAGFALTSSDLLLQTHAELASKKPTKRWKWMTYNMLKLLSEHGPSVQD